MAAGCRYNSRLGKLFLIIGHENKNPMVVADRTPWPPSTESGTAPICQQGSGVITRRLLLRLLELSPKKGCVKVT
jgi:hypothetical protein